MRLLPVKKLSLLSVALACHSPDTEVKAGEEVELSAGCLQLVERARATCKDATDLPQDRLVCPSLQGGEFASCEVLCADDSCVTEYSVPPAVMNGEFVRVSKDNSKDSRSFWLEEQDFMSILFRPTQSTLYGKAWKFPGTVFTRDEAVSVYVSSQPAEVNDPCYITFTVMHAKDSKCDSLRGTIRTLEVDICDEHPTVGQLVTEDWRCISSP